MSNAEDRTHNPTQLPARKGWLAVGGLIVCYGDGGELLTIRRGKQSGDCCVQPGNPEVAQDG